jgi:predicted  nucleic acid-binding Zn-ribbon protein
MIDESYVQAAIKIRRHYLKLTSNMDLYKRQAEKFAQSLDNISKQIESKQNELKENKLSQKDGVDNLLEIISSIEKETKQISDTIDPLNGEMEKLLKEEHELWRKIKEKYSDFDDDTIVEYVKNRLIQEGLS